MKARACSLICLLSLGTGCPRDTPAPQYPSPAELAKHPDARTFIGQDDTWREPPVLEGGTRVSFGEVVLDALAVEPPGGGPPGLVIMQQDAAGEGPNSWLTLPTSFEGCVRVEVELIEIEGLEQSGILMTQLLCDKASIPAERLSSTSLIRLLPEQSKAEILWQGEGWSLNDRELCLSYEVYSFRASRDGLRIEVLLDKEIVATPSKGMSVECEELPFAQESIEVVELGPRAPEAQPEAEPSEAPEAAPES